MNNKSILFYTISMTCFNFFSTSGANNSRTGLWITAIVCVGSIAETNVSPLIS